MKMHRHVAGHITNSKDGSVLHFTLFLDGWKKASVSGECFCASVLGIDLHGCRIRSSASCLPPVCAAGRAGAKLRSSPLCKPLQTRSPQCMGTSSPARLALASSGPTATTEEQGKQFLCSQKNSLVILKVEKKIVLKITDVKQLHPNAPLEIRSRKILDARTCPCPSVRAKQQ